MKAEVKKCHRKFCKAHWTCRVCKRKTCEHFCILKESADSSALCGRCSSANQLRLVAFKEKTGQ